MFRSIAAVGLASVLVLTGCSSPHDEEVTPSPSPPVEVPTQTPEPSPEPEVTESEEPETGFAGAVDPLQALVNEERAFVDANREAIEERFSAVTIDAEPPGGIVYTYTYAEQVDAKETIARLESAGWHDLNSDVQAKLFPIMEERGIESRQATYVYLNADDSLLVSYNFRDQGRP